MSNLVDLVAINTYREWLQQYRPHTVPWFDALRIDDQAILSNAHAETIEVQADTTAWREEMGYRPDGSD